MKNESKYEQVDGKWNVLYRGFNYKLFKAMPNWHVIAVVDTEDEAKKIAADCLDFGD